MLQKLYKLGTLVPQDSYPDDLLDLNTTYPEKNIVFLCFNNQEGQWSYTGCNLEPLDNERLEKVLFKTRTGNWRSPFPTIDVFKPGDLFKDDRPDFTRSKLGKKFSAIIKDNYGTELAGIRELLAGCETLALDLAREIQGLGRFLLSLRLDGHYLDESPWIKARKEAAKADRYADYYTLQKKTFEGKNHTCSFTGQAAERVWGLDAPYKFYAVKTELGSVAGGFQARRAWQNFPISQPALEHLLRGKKFLEDHLRFRFCGYDYFLVPEPLNATDELARKWFSKFTKRFEPFSIKKGHRNVDLGVKLVELLAKENNQANYTLLFFERSNSEFKILASVDEIFPSYNAKILKAKGEVEDHEAFKNLPGKDKTTYDLTFSFQHLKTLFPDNKKEGSFRSGFLSVVRDIFMQQPISKPFLLLHLMRTIRERFFRGEPILAPTLQGFMLLKLLTRLQLLQDPQVTKDTCSMDNKYETYFQEHRDFFEDQAIKKAVFLHGVLCQKLLNLQQVKLGNTPFRNRLNALNLNRRVLGRIFKEIKQKLLEYEDRTYRNIHGRLLETIADYYLKAQYDLASDEYGFLFVMGMCQEKQFPKEEQSDQNHEEQQ